MLRFCERTVLAACLWAATFVFPAGLSAEEGSKIPAPETFPGHTSWVTSIALSGDGEVLATGGGETLTIRPGQANFFDTTTGKSLS